MYKKSRKKIVQHGNTCDLCDHCNMIIEMVEHLHSVAVNFTIKVENNFDL